MSVVLDAGALIGIDKRDRKIGAMLRLLQREGVAVRTSAGVVGQVWRNGRPQVHPARVLAGLDVVVPDDVAAKRVGELPGANRSGDLVDAHVVLLVESGDRVLTSDEPDIATLLRARRVKTTLVHV